MSLNTTSITTNMQPECYGQLWDPNVPECAGGYDPAYVGPNGMKTRPRCDYFDSCRVRVMLKQNNQRQSNFIPAQSIVRPPMQPPQQFYVPGRQNVPIQQQQQQHYPIPTVQYSPVQMMPVSYGMPAYLTTPEQRGPGESYWSPMLREIGRGMGKAMGHAISHFFDHVPFTRKEE